MTTERWTQTVTSTGGGAAATVTGLCTLQYFDTSTGVHYASLDVAGAQFAMVINDPSGSTAEGFAIGVRNCDGSVLHASASPYDPTTATPPSAPVTSGTLEAAP